MHVFTLRISRSPVISCSASLGVYEEILGIVDISIGSGLNAIDHLPRSQAERSKKENPTTYPRLEIEQNRSRNIPCVITLANGEKTCFSIDIRKQYGYVIIKSTDLVEKNIFAISALSCELLQIPILVYAMFETQLLPELAADYRKQSVLCLLALVKIYWLAV